MLSVYKSIYNNDHLQEQLKILQDQVEALNEEINLSEKTQTSSPVCSNCFKKEETIKNLTAELKSNENLVKTAQYELSHAKDLKEQTKILQDKKIEGLKTHIFAELSSKVSLLELSLAEKHKEVIVLKDEVKQRDFFLEKAKSLVVNLNQELDKAKKEKNLAKGPEQDSKMLIENEKLKNLVQNMEKTIEELHKKMKCEDVMTRSLIIDSDTFFSGASARNTSEERMAKKERLLEKDCAQTQEVLKEVQLKNERISKDLQEFEAKCAALQVENNSLSESLGKSYESIEIYRKQQISLECELKNHIDNRHTQNIEELGRLLAQKENIIHEMTLQIAKSYKHKKHRRSVHSKDLTDLIDIIKKIVAGESADSEIFKENPQLIKDFKLWHTSFVSENKNFAEEIIDFFSENFGGIIKKNQKKLKEIAINENPKSAIKQLMGFVKSAFVTKQEIVPVLKKLKKNLYFCIQNIGLVLDKLEEIRKKLAGDISPEVALKIIDMTLDFLKKYSKERELDYELSVEIGKIINI